MEEAEFKLKTGVDDAEASGDDDGAAAMVPRRFRDPLEYERGEVQRLQRQDEDLRDFVYMHEAYKSSVQAGKAADEAEITTAFNLVLKRQGEVTSSAGARKRAQVALKHFTKYELCEDGLLHRRCYDTATTEETTRLCIPQGGTSAFGTMVAVIDCPCDDGCYCPCTIRAWVVVIRPSRRRLTRYGSTAGGRPCTKTVSAGSLVVLRANW